MQLGTALLIAGAGLLFQWIGTLTRCPEALARRLGWSLIGGGWLVYSFLAANTFLSLFQPVVDFTSAPSTLELLLSMLLPVVGAVMLVMTNVDLLGAFVTLVLRRWRGLAPISRTSLVYPLTFRFRSGVSVALFCLISFLVLFLVTTNVGAIQEAQAATNSGGFQLEATVFGSQLQRYRDLPAQLQALQQRTLLGQDFSAVGLLRLMYDYPQSGPTQPLQLDLPGQPAYPLSQPPLVAHEGFLASVTMPLYARAQGFASDQQVWNAVRTHTGDAVIQYDSRLAGLPTSNGFAPFTAEIPDSSSPSAHDHPMTIIGLMPASTPWRVLLSLQTAGQIVQPPTILFINTYLFRLQAGVSEDQAGQDLSRTLQTALRGITVQSLDQGSLNGVTAVFTVLLVGYLALGLIFGALAIGVIASRAVVERRQQIGMLRVLGFSRALVRRSFLLESGVVITLGLLTGATLALWLATQVARATYQDMPLPLVPIALIFLGSFLTALVSITPPAQRAARLPPAEALRYE